MDVSGLSRSLPPSPFISPKRHDTGDHKPTLGKATTHQLDPCPATIECREARRIWCLIKIIAALIAHGRHLSLQRSREGAVPHLCPPRVKASVPGTDAHPEWRSGLFTPSCSHSNPSNGQEKKGWCWVSISLEAEGTGLQSCKTFCFPTRGGSTSQSSVLTMRPLPSILATA